MNIFTKSQIEELFGGREGVQVIDRLVRLGLCSKQYLVDDEWVDQPQERVTAVRYNTPSINGLEDVAYILCYIKENSLESPDNVEKIRERISLPRFYDSELILFLPWGPKYSGKPKMGKEAKTLQEIRKRLGKFKERNYKTNLILMPADLYGTQINQLSESLVEDYFKRLSELASQELDGVTDLKIIPWSNIRSENDVKYQELRSQINDEFDQRVKGGQFERALAAAKIFNPSNPEESARKYCIERLVEGCLVDEVYSPVKMSLVRRDKDVLDGPLPRIYIIKNTAPWLD